MSRALLVFGTRPEAIKMAPVIRALTSGQKVEPVVAVTAQHRGMLDQVLRTFSIRPRYDLDLMRPGQTLPDLTARILQTLPHVIEEVGPAVVVVQGDTTTTFAAALVAHYQDVPIAHIEAGYRTDTLRLPFPEEANRRLVSVLADVHYAVNDRCGSVLLDEGHSADDILISGNTGIDALLHVLGGGSGTADALPDSLNARFRILMTMHRRESWGGPIEAACAAARELAATEPDIELVFSVHPNPVVRSTVERQLEGVERVRVIPPLDYSQFSRLLAAADVVLSDSGGIHEEVMFLRKPLVLLRDTTEWPEAVAAGAASLAGTDTAAILRETRAILGSLRRGEPRPVHVDPLADGHAAERIADDLARRFVSASR